MIKAKFAIELQQNQPQDSDEEQIFIKNIQTGSSENSKDLIKDNQSLLISQNKKVTVWNDYFTSLKKIQDKLLQLVIKKNHQNLLQVLTQYPIQLTKLRYMDDWTLLHFSVSQNDKISADLLLKFGIDIDATTKQMRRTALHEASLGNKVQLVDLLIQWGADPNKVDSERNSALHFAADYGYLQVTKSILFSRISVDLNIRNCMNMTTFNMCRNTDIFELLLNYCEKVSKNSVSSSRATCSTVGRNSNNHNYESRLVIRNSAVVPHNSRADMVERFLSLRENGSEPKIENNDNNSIISEQSFEGSFTEDEIRKIRNKKNRKIGAYLKNSSILKSCRKASQNIGLVRESLLKSYLQGEENIENFDILKKLGQGAFATVFLVRKKKSSGIFALKKIDKLPIIENHLKRYIETEKQILTTLKHPFILQAFTCLQDFTHLFIIMEFCQLGDLEKYVRKSPFSQSLTLSYSCEVALALEKLHNNGFLYRDLKISNILVDKTGHLKLADFGLAKKATLSDSFLGSVSYLAPQMLIQDEKKPHTKTLDWYLFGIFIYELLHGYPPFYCENRTQMESLVLTSDPIFDSSVSKKAKSVIMKLLQKDPKKRISSLKQLKQCEWFKNVDWDSIYNRNGETLQLPQIDGKQLRRKEYFVESDQDKIISEKIEWFDDWNYPKRDNSK